MVLELRIARPRTIEPGKAKEGRSLQLELLHVPDIEALGTGLLDEEESEKPTALRSYELVPRDVLGPRIVSKEESTTTDAIRFFWL